MRRISGIIHHPAAVAAKLFKELIGPRIGGDNGAVVLRTTAILMHVAGGDVDVIKQGEEAMTSESSQSDPSALEAAWGV
jgi:hypothetical protein